MKRTYNDSDDDDYYGMGGSSSYKNSRNIDLDPSKSRLKFVSAGGEPPKQTYGLQESARNDNAKETTKRRPLTDDEKNSLAAKILKAELAGKMVSPIVLIV